MTTAIRHHDRATIMETTPFQRLTFLGLSYDELQSTANYNPMPHPFFGSSALAATLAAALIAAADARADDQCFCLAHPSGAIAHYGCDAKEIPNRISKHVTCRQDDKSYGTVPIERPERFSRVEAGIGACNPCNPPPRGKAADVIRRAGQ